MVILNFSSPESREVNEGGLQLLYKIILDSAKPELCSVMNIVMAALQEGRPLLFFCKAGKDRTVRSKGRGV